MVLAGDLLRSLQLSVSMHKYVETDYDLLLRFSVYEQNESLMTNAALE